MTKREMYNTIKAIVDNMETEEITVTIENEVQTVAKQDIADFLTHEVELLNRKTSGTKKPTKLQVENAKYRDMIYDYLTTADAPKTLKEIQTGIAELNDLSCQRITHMLSVLIKENKVVRAKEKNVTYYTVTSEEETTEETVTEETEE